jgi:hypothetical protein
LDFHRITGPEQGDERAGIKQDSSYPDAFFAACWMSLL